MTDWSDYYSGQGVDSLARCVALRHHDARVGGSVLELGSFNTVTHASTISVTVCEAGIPEPCNHASTVAMSPD